MKPMQNLIVRNAPGKPEYVNLLQYGSNTNPGTTDMSGAFASAAQAAHARSGNRGGTVYVPGGSYRAENIPLDIDGEPICYVGEGVTTTLIRTVSGAAGTVLALTSGTGDMRGGGMSNMTLQGNYTGSSTTVWTVTDWATVEAIHDGIDLSSLNKSFQFVVDNVYLRGFREAFIGAQEDRSPTITNSHFRYNLRGIRTEASHPVISDSEFRFNQYAIDPVDGTLFDCVMTGVKINGNQYGIYTSGSGNIRNLVWNSGTCASNHEYGLSITGSGTAAHSSQVSGVLFIKNSAVANKRAVNILGSDVHIRNCDFVTFEAGVGWTEGCINIDTAATTRRVSVTGCSFNSMDTPAIVKRGVGTMESCNFSVNTVMHDTGMNGSFDAFFFEKLGTSGALYYNAFNNNTMAGNTSNPGDSAILADASIVASLVIYNSVIGNVLRYSSGVATGHLWDAPNVDNFISQNHQKRGAAVVDGTRGTEEAVNSNLYHA